MEEKNQFNFISNELFLGVYGDNSIEDVVFNLTKVFDDNIFILIKAEEYYKRAYDKYRKGGYENWFKNSIDVVYHLNMLIRMVNTVDDIIVKLTANTFILNVDKDRWKPKIEVGKSNDFYDKHINDNKYPEKPNKHNRYTRTLRNDVTHDGDIILQRNWITKVEEVEPGKNVEYKAILSQEGNYEHNLENFNQIYQNVIKDVEKILEERVKIENLLIDKLPLQTDTH
ncbi:hypothetical protein [Mammaliicoccus sciuri]|uniref:hypothetical protein n=1 Tax=Mammaliicoccus sciuri TaxID=1296 RepID=UPI001FB337E7|nr:hypothetical protein [Mammaliicoccus sciuri]MCJ0953560.1 hypothetical protein [Mammaliicoccus sciuri]